MADAVEVAIEAALLAHLVTFGTAESLSIAQPNVAFTPPTPTPATKYLRATFLPADSFGIGVGFDSSNQHYGLLQVDVFIGVGGGEIVPARIAADLIAHFARGTDLTRDGFTIKITGKPRRGSMMIDGSWAFVPVRIPYLCLAPNPA